LGELVAVRVPSPEEEAARDLVRAREDARGDLMRARHRLSKLLLRHGLVCEGSARTVAHDAWLRRQWFASRPLALAFDEGYGAVLQAKGRRDGLDQAIADLGAEPHFVDVVGRLVCLRGFSTVTALALTVELGDSERFRPQSLGAFPALVPSEDFLRRAAPAGGDHEDGQQARSPPARRGRLAPPPASTRERGARAAAAGAAGGGPGACRCERPSPPALARARGRGKQRSVVAVAVARDLADHCWALATME
jgi:transposase